MVTPDDIIAAARECIGTPYSVQGRLPGVRLDCVGLVMWPARKLGLPVEDIFAYHPDMDPGAARREVLRRAVQRVGAPRPSDVLWLRTAHDPTHFAILTRENTIIHSSSREPRRVVEHGFRHPFPRLVCDVFAYPGVTHPEDASCN